MTLNIESFRNIAKSAWFTSRDIAVQGQGDNATVRLGNYILSQGKAINDATMSAFKAALEKEYGVFGTNAFDTVVGSRAQLHKSLRASDVKATLSSLENVKKNHFIDELSRQLDTSPKFRELSDGMRKLVRDAISATPFDGNLRDCSTPEDIVKKASARIDEAIQNAKDFVAERKRFNPKYDVSTESTPLAGRRMTETAAKPNEATGLRNLKTVFGKGSTSVEDQIKRGTLGAGMRINRSITNPVLLEKLKTNGVEPGFIFRNDWSTDDTHGYMADIYSPESTDALENLKLANQHLAEKCAGKDKRTQILLAGRAHPAAMAAAAELLLEKAAQLVLDAKAEGKSIDDMKDVSPAVKKLAKAVKNQFQSTNDLNALAHLGEKTNKALLHEAKVELFTAIRDAVMNVKDGDAEYEASPVFKHFAERGIVKLDYNEGSKFSSGDTAHAGTFMRPERIIVGRKMGQLYRFQTRTTADHASAGAVTEALANDLTRLAGIPSQELEIVRGQYSDGHPKIMLAAKFADGYKDMEAGMLKDGRIVKPEGAPKDLQMESLGKYKAFFLVTADRDGVGSRGQNKGFIDGKFFAIDPGHSLEGNGKYLEISDDLSFKDTYGKSTKPRFKNFSVFDDDTRFAKFSGILDLREKARNGTFDKLFDEYRAAFDPDAKDLTPEEKALRVKIKADINKKQNEFKESLNKVLRAGGMQLELYDALEDASPAVKQGAIETLGNLEKLFSPTTWVSKHGEVALNHLEVIPESRVKWSAGMEGDNIVYHCDKPIDRQMRTILESIAKEKGATIETDAMGVTRLVVPKGNAESFFAAFTEDKVQQLTHPEEYLARHTEGGDPLKTAKTYRPVTPATGEVANPMTAAQLPEELDIPVDGVVVRLPKIHYEDMVTTKSRFPRPASVGELRAMMGARIRRGNDILRALLHGKIHRFEANTENCAALTIALHVAALKKGEFMYRGSFSVADPDGQIAKWLDMNPEIYQRTSTHAAPYQEMEVDGHLNMPRGLDVPTGMGGLLNGMRTFHYFTIPDTDHLNDAGGSGPKRRLFLKCETYGIFCSTAHFHPFKKADAKSEGMKTRSYQFGDIIESIQHGGSLFVSKFTSKTANGIRKENMPAELANEIYNAAGALRKAGFQQVADRVLKGVYEGGGLKLFLENVQREIKNLPEGEDVRALETIGPNLDQLNARLKSLNGIIDNRMGNEVVLEIKDIIPE